jgi:hypothetical protein
LYTQRAHCPRPTGRGFTRGFANRATLHEPNQSAADYLQGDGFGQLKTLEFRQPYIGLIHPDGQIDEYMRKGYQTLRLQNEG